MKEFQLFRTLQKIEKRQFTTATLERVGGLQERTRG